MKRNQSLASPALWFLFIAGSALGDNFDIVISGGRVIDPETGLDGVRNVGILSDHVVAVTEEELSGNRVLNATGLVVAPGFIDLHQHDHSQKGYRRQALDGITAAFELEAGVPDITGFVNARAGQNLIHFGASAGHYAARYVAMDTPMPASQFGPAAGIPPPTGSVANDPATPQQLQQVLEDLASQIKLGKV